MLGHKSSSRIKAWLTDLTEKEVIGRTYSRKFGENTNPAVYYLSAKSKFFLKEQKDINVELLDRIYKERMRSQSFRERSILIGGIYLHLEALAKENKSELQFYTKTELETHDYLPKALPDAYIFTKELDTTTRYFLYAISEQIPRFVLRNLVEGLIDYFDTKTWQEQTGYPFPKILIVCPNYVTKGFLSKFIEQTLEENDSDISFYLTTKNQIEAQGMKPDIWQKVVVE